MFSSNGFDVGSKSNCGGGGGGGRGGGSGGGGRGGGRGRWNELKT